MLPQPTHLLLTRLLLERPPNNLRRNLPRLAGTTSYLKAGWFDKRTTWLSSAAKYAGGSMLACHHPTLLAPLSAQSC
jgi:hypothetical protein